MPHRCPSLDHRLKHQWWASHTVVVRSDYCPPFLMSTNHPWTDRSRLVWHLESRLKKACQETQRTLVLQLQQMNDRHIQLLTGVQWSLEMAAKAWSVPNKSKLNWINCTQKRGGLPVFKKKLIFLDIKCLLHCCVSLCSVAVRHSRGLSIWWLIYVN